MTVILLLLFCHFFSINQATRRKTGQLEERPWPNGLQRFKQIQNETDECRYFVLCCVSKNNLLRFCNMLYCKIFVQVLDKINSLISEEVSFKFKPPFI